MTTWPLVMVLSLMVLDLSPSNVVWASCGPCKNNLQNPPSFSVPISAEYSGWIADTFGEDSRVVKASYVDRTTTDPNIYFMADEDENCYLDITFVYVNTNSRNQIGYFTFDKANVPKNLQNNQIPASFLQARRMLFEDISDFTPNCLPKGTTIRAGPFKGTHALGFYLISNGACAPSEEYEQRTFWTIDLFNMQKILPSWKSYPATGRLMAVIKDPIKNRFHLGFEDSPHYDQDYNDVVLLFTSTCPLDQTKIPCILKSPCPAGQTLHASTCTCGCKDPGNCEGFLVWDPLACKCTCPTGQNNPCKGTICQTSTCNAQTGRCDVTPTGCPGKVDSQCLRWVCDEQKGGCFQQEVACAQPTNKCKRNVCRSGSCVLEDIPRPAWAVNDACNKYTCNTNTGVWENAPTVCSPNSQCRSFSCDPLIGCKATILPCTAPQDKCKESYCNPTTFQCETKNKARPADKQNDACNTYTCNSLTGEWLSSTTSCGQDTACRKWTCDPVGGCKATISPCPSPADKCKESVCNPTTFQCDVRDKAQPADKQNDPCNTYTCNPTTGAWDHQPTICGTDTECRQWTCDPQTGCKSTILPCAEPQDKCKESFCDTTGTFQCKQRDKPRPQHKQDDACKTFTCNPSSGAWEQATTQCPASDLCNSWSCHPEHGCQNIPTQCPSDTECSRWSCDPNSTTDLGEVIPLGCVRKYTECPAPTNRCTKNTCTLEGVCFAEDLPRPDDLPLDDFCQEFQCHPTTGEWQNRTTVAAQECLSKEGSGCAEWMCDSEHGCLLSVRLGCCEEGEMSNCTSCEEVTGCLWDATSESCEAIAELPLELATALPDHQGNPTGHNNWEELISGCPTETDGGSPSDSNTPAVVAGAVSAGVGALAALGAAGAFAWRMKRRSQLKSRLSVQPPTMTPMSNFSNPLFTSSATEGTNPLYPGNS
ncbi:homophilic cell adhesion via plasma membrane adhesion molecules [Balamuthia mandrillaris]